MEYKNSRTANRRRYKSRYHSPHNYKTKRSKSENRAAILVAIATFLVIASLVLVFTFGENIYAFVDGIFHPAAASADEPTQAPSVAQTTEPTVAPTIAPTDAPTEPPTDAPTEPDIPQSADFVRLASAAGLNTDDLYTAQMIFVESAGTSATVYTYELGDGGVWEQKFSPIRGYVGEGGVASSVGPADTTLTPSGTYAIEYAMGLNPDPGTMLVYYSILDGMRWITDPNSSVYNRWLNPGSSIADFNSSQWMYEYTLSYPYMLVFDYNRSTSDPAKGCAKFLHVGSAPTKTGGVGISEDDLRSILLWLDPSAVPMISIF